MISGFAVQTVRFSGERCKKTVERYISVRLIGPKKTPWSCPRSFTGHIVIPSAAEGTRFDTVPSSSAFFLTSFKRIIPDMMVRTMETAIIGTEPAERPKKSAAVTERLFAI